MFGIVLNFNYVVFDEIFASGYIQYIVFGT